jgi:hypothetical protein
VSVRGTRSRKPLTRSSPWLARASVDGRDFAESFADPFQQLIAPHADRIGHAISKGSYAEIDGRTDVVGVLTEPRGRSDPRRTPDVEAGAGGVAGEIPAVRWMLRWLAMCRIWSNGGDKAPPSPTPVPFAWLPSRRVRIR